MSIKYRIAHPIMYPLLSCPFCGDNNPREAKDDNYTWCTNPQCPIYDTEITREEWNMRYAVHQDCFYAGGRGCNNLRLDAD